MTDQEMRIAIAEACPDWTYHHGGLYCAITNCENRTLAGRLFDPLEDLNAMNEAEKTLNEKMWVNYIEHLKSITGFYSNTYKSVRAKIHADARQRAEAFLRAIGKWRNG